jgi:hypothetical protein
MEDQRVAFSAKTLYAPIGWPFKAGLCLGAVQPGLYGGKAKSEVNALHIGEIEMINRLHETLGAAGASAK